MVAATNTAGSTNSEPATLTVRPFAETFSLVTYNAHGNGVEDWSTNSAQVQAIGRQMMHLKPDIVTFQEISVTNTWEMTNFVAAYLPGYQLATNSGSDGYIRSVIVSRFPITRSTRWLDGIDLRSFGYSNANNSLDNFTRDLFEAQIALPGLPNPLHVFTAHLKSGPDPDDDAKRAAEANAISNFFAAIFLPLHTNDPYVLTGDMNESDTNQLSIQRLIGPPTGLQLTTPVNPYTASELTFSIQSNLTKRYDYILPGNYLFTNIASSQVFRTDKLNPAPPGLNGNDDIVASDHLPVLMRFYRPPDAHFRITSIGATNQVVTVKWESESGRQYRAEASPDSASWVGLATNVTAAGTNCSFSTNANGDMEFFRVYRVP
jgi:endonuclease/exonuclease/phosphatase family metal-dependent hydrolase